MISVLLNVAPDGGQESRLQAALALVKAHGGHITCVHTVEVLPMAPGPDHRHDRSRSTRRRGGSGERIPENRRSGARRSRCRLDLAALLRRSGDLPDGALAPRRCDRHDRERFIPADLERRSACPQSGPRGSTAEPQRHPRAACADRLERINPSRKCGVRAMPIFEAMQPVHVLAVDDDSRESPASLVQEFLVEHEIQSEVHWRPSDGEPVVDAILECAEEMGIDMIVAGAFGHNRLREMLLGSVTRQLMEKSSRPLFLSH